MQHRWSIGASSKRVSAHMQGHNVPRLLLRKQMRRSMRSAGNVAIGCSQRASGAASQPQWRSAEGLAHARYHSSPSDPPPSQQVSQRARRTPGIHCSVTASARRRLRSLHRRSPCRLHRWPSPILQSSSPLHELQSPILQSCVVHCKASSNVMCLFYRSCKPLTSTENSGK